MVPRENKNNAHAKFAGQTKSVMVFSEMANIFVDLHAFGQRSTLVRRIRSIDSISLLLS